MKDSDLRIRIDNAVHIMNEIRYAENILDELFFSKPTASIAPPPVNFFTNYTNNIFHAVEEAKAAYEKNRSFIESINPDHEPFPKEEIIYPENFGELIGQRIKDRRAALGITQNDLSEQTGIRRPNIARLERGQSLPNLTTLVKVSSALKITLPALLQL